MTNFLQDSAGTAGIICDVLMVKKDLKRGGRGRKLLATGDWNESKCLINSPFCGDKTLIYYFYEHDYDKIRIMVWERFRNKP
jgi:hypothetical protein